jgi:glycosyltransferase involved in cell wall biosynthesis
MQEVAQGCAMYFDPKDAQSIAAAIRHIYDPAFDRSNYLDEKAEILRKYSWEHSAATLLSIMREVHERTRRIPRR